jgi:release factor glutamine methyltransferase
MPSVKSVLQAAAAQLADDTAMLDAQLLLAKALGKTRTWLYAWPDFDIAEPELERFQTLLVRRASGEPVAYLLGEREFWSQPLTVSPAVLIPRPETELLVEITLELGPSTPARVADLGTGSGAIALALAKERPQWQVHATELSPEAFQVAIVNVQRSQLTNVQVHAGSWMAPLPAEQFDLIVSNPPYIAADDPHLQQGDVRFEPRSALVAAEQGLADLRYLIATSPTKLAKNGWLVVEHGWQQGAAVRNLFAQQGYHSIATRKDGGGRERVSYGCWPGLQEGVLNHE